MVGICNGFQVLTEAGLLPGCAAEERPAALLVPAGARGGGLDRVGAHRGGARSGDELVIPINHFSGNYTCDDETLRRLQAEDRIVLRYADNPNGSVDDIAGIANEARQRRRPHAPPRAGQCTRCWAPTDGLVLLRSLVARAPAARAAAA